MGRGQRRQAEHRHPGGHVGRHDAGGHPFGGLAQQLLVGEAAEALLHGPPQRGLPAWCVVERATAAVDVAALAPDAHHLRAVERVAVEQVGDGPGPHRVGGLAQLRAELLEDLVHRPGERTGGPTADARALAHRPGDDAGGEHELDVGDDAVAHRPTRAVPTPHPDRWHRARWHPAGGPAAAVSHAWTPPPGTATSSGVKGSSSGSARTAANASANGSSDPATVRWNATRRGYPPPVTASRGGAHGPSTICLRERLHHVGDGPAAVERHWRQLVGRPHHEAGPSGRWPVGRRACHRLG